MVMSRRIWSLFAARMLAGAALLGAAAGMLRAQDPLPGRMKNFKISPEFFPPPHQGQMKSLLQGEEAQPQDQGRIAIQQARLDVFRQTGEAEIVVRAPECLYDTSRREASSSGPLRVEAGDGKFSIEGQGFLWRQADSSLEISNRVRTWVHPDLLAGNAAAPTAKSAPTPAGIEIRADRFSYLETNGLAVYTGHVRAQAEGTNLTLASERLVLRLPSATRQVEAITAERGVSLNYSGAEATGERGVYTVKDGRIRLAGNPAWRADERQGRGDELLVDRSNRVFTAVGNAWLKLPDEGGGNRLFSSSERGVSPAGALEVRSDRYEIHTNSARFEGRVRASEPPETGSTNQLTCELLNVYFAGSNTLRRITADREVILSQEDRQFRAGRAVYTATNGLLVLTQNPSWRAGLREGRGHRITVQTPANELTVSGDAFLRLPADELAQAEAGTPAVKPTAFSEITSGEYTARAGLAVFRGGVRVTHPQMNWICETLTVEAGQGAETWRKIVARRGVIFDLTDEQGQKVHGKGDEAVYDFSVNGSATNELVKLHGAPATLENTNATVQNAEIVLDRRRNQVIAPGATYQIHGAASVPGGGLILPQKLQP